MQQKKILFTSHTANFSKFNRPFMRWLKERDFVVHYASAGEEEVLDCDKHFNIPFSRNPLKPTNLRALYQLRKIIAHEKYDIIHTHTPVGSVITRLAATTARKKGTRVVYTAHGFHFFKGAPILNWLTYYPIEKLMANYTDILVTINEEDYAIAKRKFNTDVRYIAGVGIDQQKFNLEVTQKEKETLRASIGLKNDDFVILYLAELSKRKNQLWLIQSLSKLIKNNSDIHLVLAGQDSLNGRCQRLTEKLGVDTNVHFLGYRNDTAELLSITDIVASSSLQEGLPVNIMEAMYIGIPVVAIDCRGSRDLIKDAKNGFIVQKSARRNFADKVLHVKGDRSFKDITAQNNKSLITPYLLEKILPEMTSIYRIGGTHE